MRLLAFYAHSIPTTHFAHQKLVLHKISAVQIFIDNKTFPVDLDGVIYSYGEIKCIIRSVYGRANRKECITWSRMPPHEHVS